MYTHAAIYRFQLCTHILKKTGLLEKKHIVQLDVWDLHFDILVGLWYIEKEYNIQYILTSSFIFRILKLDPMCINNIYRIQFS